DQIKKMDAFDNTLIFFVSDNGASAEQIIRGDMHDKSAAPGSARSYLCLGPGWSTASNSPLRLHKSWVHEGGASSPLIVHWPAGVAARGELRHDPCHFIDVVPTVLDLTGSDDFSAEWNGETAVPLPGTSLAPGFVKNNSIKHDFIYFHHGNNRAIRVGDWKLVAKGKDGPWELYNLKSDRCETKDLADSYPDKVRELSAIWQRHEDEFRRQAGPAPEKSKRRRR
ncbi:MAG: sulfatase-like hydrolase/transferase, partial [Planctomycetota bacterium]